MRGLRHRLQFGIFLRQADELLGRKIRSGHIGLNLIPPCLYGANPVGGYLHQFRPSLWATASMAIISCSPLCKFFTAASPRTSSSSPMIRSEEHTSELQSLMRISYAVFCLKKKRNKSHHHIIH